MKRGLLILAILIFSMHIVFAFCGDGLIDSDDSETCKTCPQDNPCYVDQKCINGICINKLIPPLFLREDPKATIIIPLSISETLNTLLDQPHEFAVCLKGLYAESIYQITEIEFPQISGQSIYAVEHAKCRGFNVVATLHSHLDGSCELSSGDIFSFGQKHEPLTAIVCGKNDFAFYSKLSFTKRMNYLIREIENTRLNYFWSIFPWIFSFLLIIVLLILFYERERLHNARKADKAIELIEKFSQQQKAVVNNLIKMKTLGKKDIKKKILETLTKDGIVEERNKKIVLTKWFKKAIKKI